MELYRRGLEISPKLPQLHNGVGIVLMDQAGETWDRGGDPEPELAQARAAFEQAIAAAPDQGFGYDNVGEVFIQRAWFQAARGEDPSTNVQAAADALIRAIERIPDYPRFWANLGTAHTILAGYELDHGRDPRPSLAQATRALRNALTRNPKDAQSQLYLAQTRGISASFEARQRRGNAEDFAAAADAFQQAIELAPETWDYQLLFAQVCHDWAVVQQRAGADPVASLVRGLQLVQGVLTMRPRWPDALVVRGSLLLVQAQSSASPGKRRDLASQAATDFAAALATHPALGNVWSTQAAAARQLVSAP